MSRFWESSILTRFESAGHIRTISCRHIENNGCLLAVGSASVDLGSFLSVTAGEQKRHRGGKLGLTLFFRNLDVGSIELPIAVGLENAEDVPNDLFRQSMSSKGFLAQVPLVWQRLSMNMTA